LNHELHEGPETGVFVRFVQFVVPGHRNGQIAFLQVPL